MKSFLHCKNHSLVRIFRSAKFLTLSKSNLRKKEHVAGNMFKPVTSQSAKFVFWDADFIDFLWFLIDVGYQNKPKSIFDVALKT